MIFVTSHAPTCTVHAFRKEPTPGCLPEISVARIDANFDLATLFVTAVVMMAEDDAEGADGMSDVRMIVDGRTAHFLLSAVHETQIIAEDQPDSALAVLAHALENCVLMATPAAGRA